MLADLGVREVRLLTNNPAKIAGLTRHGIAVVERVPLQVQPNPHNRRYLRAKREKMGHLLAAPPPEKPGTVVSRCAASSAMRAEPAIPRGSRRRN
jgi:hypothetical protein